MASNPLQKSNQDFVAELAKNLIAGLAVSFVAISLGAAFGILSTRGAFAGILSAGIRFLISPISSTNCKLAGFSVSKSFLEISPSHQSL